VKKLSSLMLVFIAVLLSGCAGSIKNMREVAADAPALKPQQGEAMVVFMRPSGIGFAIQSSVFDIVNDTPSLVGIVAAKTKVAYKTKPGTHLFMSVGENADFMTAELLPNKTYYAYVSPRMGMWKARFVLEPKTLKDLDEAGFKSDLEECKWVEVSAESQQWLSENMPSVQSKRTEYYADWQKQPEEEKLKLRPADGR
jgi:hypothetical protein